MQRGATTPSLGTLSLSARAVIRELLVSGPLPRAELARRMGLSPASLTKTTRPLLISGVVREVKGRGTETRGRPGTPLELDAGRHQFIGFKVTGDELFGVRSDALGRVQEAAYCPLTSSGVDEVAQLIIDLVNKLRGTHTIQAIGIGLAGMMRRFDRTVRHNIFLNWNDVPLAQMVEQETAIPTVLSGDARALTAGVQWSGPGRGLSDFAVVTVGVGIGLGVVVDGTVLTGPYGNAAMVGHTRISDSGP
ncbi:ROK family protein, partial [Phytoactinopolyspora endophytica]|uniref:ROK family protein n=1 Tax=Phytoactinopolyspora endophytica TaxID=1642495 RepID=UPI0013EBD2D1